MHRIDLPERPDWRHQAEKLGFLFHTMHGEPYWDETSAYAFSLEQIERDIEEPAARLHRLCLEAVAEVATSEELMARLGVPGPLMDYVRASWERAEPSLYGRFDLSYDGAAPPKLLEYNADTPTSLYEAAAFQWLWLEQLVAQGQLPPGADQFNGLHEALVARFRALFRAGENVHFASVEGSAEDFATVEYLAWTANEAGLVPHHTPVEKIALTRDGHLADDADRVIGTLFKLYPWEDMLRDDFASALPGCGCRLVEPPWKALASNKGLLPVLWRMFEGDPNLLPAFFVDELEAGGPRVERARAALERGHVEKPIFSREGASIRIVENGVEIAASTRRDYDAHDRIVQAYAALPVYGRSRAVVGAWIVGDACVGMGLREDDDLITQDLSRFKPHVILPEPQPLYAHMLA
ncbi:MAG: glutathionylspermidine synthase family protein [Woeseiaceae bacterium]|nr:glutathionylspermidine synthase family protein [Woeseiaceae bacterium]